MQRLTHFLLLAMLLTPIAFGCRKRDRSGDAPATANVQLDQKTATAVEQLKKLGAKVEVDGKTDPPAVSVSLGDTGTKDADLTVLADVRGLQSLTLERTKITDAGLERLKVLTGLRFLNLNETK